MTPKLLWSQLKKECKAYFDWELESDSCDSFVEQLQISKVLLLRSFCTKTGIQILLRSVDGIKCKGVFSVKNTYYLSHPGGGVKNGI